MIRGRYVTSLEDTTEIMDIRRRVFVDEQGFSADTEIDESDKIALYALVYDECDLPVGTGRLCPDADGRMTIGRVAVLKEQRGSGIGDLVMRMLLYRAREMGLLELHIGSQLHAAPFYERYGFKQFGETYLDEGQPHMHLKVAISEINLNGTCVAE